MAITKLSTSSLKDVLKKTNLIEGSTVIPVSSFTVVGSTYLWGTGSQTKSTALPAGTITGDFVLHLCASDGAVQANTPIGFTRVYRGDGDTGIEISYRFVQAGDTTVSVTQMTSDAIHAFYVFRGVNTSVPITTPIVAPKYTDPGTSNHTPNPSLITTQAANSVVLAPIFLDDYLGTPVAPAGYTQLTTYRSNLDTNSPWYGITAPADEGDATTVGLAYLQTTNAGQYDPGVWTGSLGNDSVVATLELRLA